MIRKLRIKLIITSMVSLFSVLLIVMGTISLLNYRGVIEDADQILGILAENDGSFPDIPDALGISDGGGGIHGLDFSCIGCNRLATLIQENRKVAGFIGQLGGK